MKPIEDTPEDQAWWYFESSWRSDVAPDIWEAIAMAGIVADRAGLAIEFAMIDLEWRWRKGITDQPRSFTFYKDMLSVLNLQPEHLVSLLEHEFIVRSRWGDRPTIDKMLVDMSDHKAAITPMLEEALDKNYPVFHRLLSISDGELFSESRHELFTEFGRQRDGEPAKFESVPLSRGKRIVIADESDAHVAETLFEFRRVSFNQILCVSHVAENLGCIYGKPLALGSQTIEVPCKIEFADFILALDCKYSM